MRALAFFLVITASIECGAGNPAGGVSEVSASRQNCRLHTLFGVTVGTSKADVHATLGAVGSLSREERKRQEVWDVRDARYRGVIVGYDTDWNVRFVTAVAKGDGTPVHYADVLDRAAATHRTTGSSHNYSWRADDATYTVIAIGNDPERLTYVTLTRGEED